MPKLGYHGGGQARSRGQAVAGHFTDSEEQAYTSLHHTLGSYHPLSDATWSAFRKLCRYRTLVKHEVLYPLGEVPTSYAYVHAGVFRVYVLDEKGTEYNKHFFTEGRFPGSMTALLRGEPSGYCIDALEDAVIIEIDHGGFRRLLREREDLKLFHIHYLERHWLLDKDAREVSLVQEDASARYRRFLREYPELATRLPQYHIASHLGITPTQLSRIRKKM